MANMIMINLCILSDTIQGEDNTIPPGNTFPIEPFDQFPCEHAQGFDYIPTPVLISSGWPVYG